MPINHHFENRPTIPEPEKQRPKDLPLHSGIKITRAGYDLSLKLSDEFYYWLDKHPDSVKKIQEELERLVK